MKGERIVIDNGAKTVICFSRKKPFKMAKGFFKLSVITPSVYYTYRILLEGRFSNVANLLFESFNFFAIEFVAIYYEALICAMKFQRG